MAKAIALFSGGLDSILAICVLRAQGVEIEALHFVTLFTGGTGSARRAAALLGVPLTIRSRSRELLALAIDPPHGHGSNVNPCIDCKIDFLRAARAYMEERGADFLISGEVLGQRPMSQTGPALRMIEKQAGVEGILVRPLSAGVLPPTMPETQGFFRRDLLPAIRGRSRLPQIALAAQYGITEYPAPAGGCLLTDPGYARRFRDLLGHGEADLNNAHLAKMGRHFRLANGVKLIIGRHEEDNEKMRPYARPGDFIIELADAPGPLGLLRGSEAASFRDMAASAVVRYSKLRAASSVAVAVTRSGEGEPRIARVDPAATDEFSRFIL